MWGTINTTPYACENTFIRDLKGRETWVTIVKCTFDILPDMSLELAKEQTPIYLEAEYTGEIGKSSLLYESDLVIQKTATDILLNGNAYAPKGEKVPMLDASMKVGNLQKTLRIFGDRTWEKGMLKIKTTPPKPFSKMPILYERSFGGTEPESENSEKPYIHPENPIGTGFVKQKKNLQGIPVPNIYLPKPNHETDVINNKTAGFGAIAREWMPRIQFAGTYNEDWKNNQSPLYPKDFSCSFFQIAPKDQQTKGFINGGEHILLNNLSANGNIDCYLPLVQLNFCTYFVDSKEYHEAKLYTLILEPDIPRCIMIWFSALPCQGKEHLLKYTRIVGSHSFC